MGKSNSKKAAKLWADKIRNYELSHPAYVYQERLKNIDRFEKLLAKRIRKTLKEKDFIILEITKDCYMDLLTMTTTADCGVVIDTYMAIQIAGKMTIKQEEILIE